MQPKLTKEWLNRYPLLLEVVQILQVHHLEAYLVGGAVRDLLLGRNKIVDLDFAVPGDGLVVARQVANTLGAAYYPLDVERGIGRVVLRAASTKGEAAQTAYGMRSGSTSHNRLYEALPLKIYFDFATIRGATLLDDLADRDFTINAIALDLSKTIDLIDPLQGQHDLVAKQIRATSAIAFKRDPVRVLRAVRQTVELGFEIEAQTKQALQEAAAELPNVSPERRRDELLKLLNTSAPGQAVQMLRYLGVLPYILPEIEPLVGVSQGPPHYLDVFDHSTAALDAWAELIERDFSDFPVNLRTQVKQQLSEPLAGDLTQQSLIPLALLLHDAGKPSTRTQETNPEIRIRFIGHEQVGAQVACQVMQRFHFSIQAIHFVEIVVAQHMRPLLLAAETQVSRRAAYRFFRDTNGGAFRAGIGVALHALADHQATYPPGQGEEEWRQLMAVVTQLAVVYFEQRDQVITPPTLLTGRDLMERWGLAEGPLIGVLLDRLREAQAVGEVIDKATALAFIEADPNFLKQKT